MYNKFNDKKDNYERKSPERGYKRPSRSFVNKDSRDNNSPERGYKRPSSSFENKDSRDNKSFPKPFPVKSAFNSSINDDDYDRDDANSKFDDDGPKSNYIIGRNPVLEALKAEKSIDTIFVNAGAGGSINHIISLAKQQNIVVKEVTDIKLSSMVNGASHQGIIAVGAYAEYVSIEDILQIAKDKGEDPFIIICDEIEDPHNLGAIIRTAEAAGAHGLIIPKRRSATLNYTVNKTSAGAASWLPVARVPNIVSSIEILKKNGVWIYGTDASGEDYTKTNLTGSIGLVIGSEGSGIGRLVREKCDYLIKLPMMGKISSLNASVAGGIFMYEILRQKLNSNKK